MSSPPRSRPELLGSFFSMKFVWRFVIIDVARTWLPNLWPRWTATGTRLKSDVAAHGTILFSGRGACGSLPNLLETEDHGISSAPSHSTEDLVLMDARGLSPYLDDLSTILCTRRHPLWPGWTGCQYSSLVAVVCCWQSSKGRSWWPQGSECYQNWNGSVGSS